MSNNNLKHFKTEPLNITNFVKVNDLKPIDNPIFFDNNSTPTIDGLLSNEIFGITKDERSTIFAQIPLGENEVFIHPMAYRVWTKVDRKIKDVVHGTKYFTIKNGELVEDDNGDTGIKFLHKNFKNLKFKKNGSITRDAIIDFLIKYSDRIFVKNMVVIPAYYRDVKTDGKFVGVGDINQLYSRLIVSANSLKDAGEYGLTLSNSIRGRIQEALGDIYDYFTKGVFNGEPVTGIAGKFGILRRANMSKTTDYSSRTVISAPELKVENVEDMITDLDHTAVPLASLTANYFPQIIFYMRRFFEKQFSGHEVMDIKDKNGKDVLIHIGNDYMIQFSDDVLKKELDRFSHGVADRFRPIQFKDSTKKNIYTMYLKGYKISQEEYFKLKDKKDVSELPILTRPMTWCDLIFMAACEAVKDKCVLITRYPMDSYFNQYPSKVNVSSTLKTRPMIVNNEFYKFYPDISEDELNTDTTNKFTDTTKPCNLYLDSIGGDYDGDTISIKSLYSIEANEELNKILNSKKRYIDLCGTSILQEEIECLQSLYNLTMVLPDDMKKLTFPEF